MGTFLKINIIKHMDSLPLKFFIHLNCLEEKILRNLEVCNRCFDPSAKETEAQIRPELSLVSDCVFTCRVQQACAGAC